MPMPQEELDLSFLDQFTAPGEKKEEEKPKAPEPIDVGGLEMYDLSFLDQFTAPGQKKEEEEEPKTLWDRVRAAAGDVVKAAPGIAEKVMDVTYPITSKIPGTPDYYMRRAVEGEFNKPIKRKVPMGEAPTEPTIGRMKPIEEYVSESKLGTMMVAPEYLKRRAERKPTNEELEWGLLEKIIDIPGQFLTHFDKAFAWGLPEFIPGDIPAGKSEIADVFGAVGSLMGLAGSGMKHVATMSMEKALRATGLRGAALKNAMKEYLGNAEAMAKYSPFRVTGSLVNKLFGKPAKTLAGKMIQNMLQHTTQLSIAMAATEWRGEDAKEILKNKLKAAEGGAKMGAIFGGAQFIHFANRHPMLSLILRMGIGSVALDMIEGEHPLDERSLFQKTFDYGLKAYFLRAGVDPKTLQRTSESLYQDIKRYNAQVRMEKQFQEFELPDSLVEIGKRITDAASYAKREEPGRLPPAPGMVVTEAGVAAPTGTPEEVLTKAEYARRVGETYIPQTGERIVMDITPKPGGGVRVTIPAGEAPQAPTVPTPARPTYQVPETEQLRDIWVGYRNMRQIDWDLLKQHAHIKQGRVSPEEAITFFEERGIPIVNKPGEARAEVPPPPPEQAKAPEVPPEEVPPEEEPPATEVPPTPQSYEMYTTPELPEKPRVRTFTDPVIQAMADAGGVRPDKDFSYEYLKRGLRIPVGLIKNSARPMDEVAASISETIPRIGDSRDLESYLLDRSKRQASMGAEYPDWYMEQYDVEAPEETEAEVEYVTEGEQAGEHAGAGGWSPEALKRGENIQFVTYNPKTRKVTPIPGVEAVDIPVKPNEIKAQINKNTGEITILDKGKNLGYINSERAKAGIKESMPKDYEFARQPEEAAVYKKTLYRGISDKTPVDEGMFGKGQYWTNDKKYASQYGEDVGGKTTAATISLRNPLVTSKTKVGQMLSEIKEIIRGDVKPAELNEKAAEGLKKRLEVQGYDGIVMQGEVHKPEIQKNRVKAGYPAREEEVVIFNPEKSVTPEAPAPEVPTEKPRGFTAIRQTTEEGKYEIKEIIREADKEQNFLIPPKGETKESLLDFVSDRVAEGSELEIDEIEQGRLVDVLVKDSEGNLHPIGRYKLGGQPLQKIAGKDIMDRFMEKHYGEKPEVPTEKPTLVKRKSGKAGATEGFDIKIGNNIIGGMDVYPEEYKFEDGSVEEVRSVEGVKIQEKYRGLGFGKDLYKLVNAELQKEGKRLYSDANISEEAKRVWESLVRDGVAEKVPPRQLYDDVLGEYFDKDDYLLYRFKGQPTRPAAFKPEQMEMGMNPPDYPALSDVWDRIEQETSKLKDMREKRATIPQLISQRDNISRLYKEYDRLLRIKWEEQHPEGETQKPRTPKRFVVPKQRVPEYRERGELEHPMMKAGVEEEKARRERKAAIAGTLKGDKLEQALMKGELEGIELTDAQKDDLRKRSAFEDAGTVPEEAPLPNAPTEDRPNRMRLVKVKVKNPLGQMEDLGELPADKIDGIVEYAKKLGISDKLELGKFYEGSWKEFYSPFEHEKFVRAMLRDVKNEPKEKWEEWDKEAKTKFNEVYMGLSPVEFCRTFGQKFSKYFQVEPQFKAIGAPNTGLALKLYFPRMNAELSWGEARIKELAKLAKKAGLTDDEFIELTWVAARPGKFYPKTEAERRRFSPVYREVRKFFNDYAERLREAEVIEEPFPQSAIRRLGEERVHVVAALERARTETRKVKLQRELQKIDDNLAFLKDKRIQYVHIPRMWLRNLWEADPQRFTNVISEYFRPRENVDIEALGKWLLSKGYIEKADLDIRRIMAAYSYTAGKKLALAEIISNAKAEGLVLPRETAPDGWMQLPSRMFPTLKGQRVHPIFGEYFDRNIRNLKSGTAILPPKVGRVLGAIKLMQFYNPLFLPMYDMYQGFWAGSTRTPWRILKYGMKAFKSVKNKDTAYWDAQHWGLMSTPFTPNFNTAVKRISKVARNNPAYKRMMKIANPISWVDGLYKATWNTAWAGDNLVRMMTYHRYISKGYSPREAAQLGARLHADYASVPPRYRNIYNKLLFTPSFKITMLAAQGEMVKNFGKLATNWARKGGGASMTGYEKEMGKALIGLVGGFLLRDFVMKNVFGFENADTQTIKSPIFGTLKIPLFLKYSKTVESEGKKKELAFHMASPDNVLMRYLHKATTWWTSPNKWDAFWNRAKWELHPVYQWAMELANNSSVSLEPIYNPFDKSTKVATDVMEYTARRLIRIFEVIPGGEGIKRAEAYNALVKDMGKIGYIMSGFGLPYLRGTKQERLLWQMEDLQRRFQQMEKSKPAKTTEAREARFEDYINELKRIRDEILKLQEEEK